MVQIIKPGDGNNTGNGFNPPTKSTGNKINNVQLLTSTGGLSGIRGLLMTPSINPLTGKSFITVYDPSNFNCEEDCSYISGQETQYGEYPGEGKDCSIHLIIIKYREIGNVSFEFQLQVYKRQIDSYESITIPVTIPQKQKQPWTKARTQSFPDNMIHTVKLHPPKGVITGEMPSWAIVRSANSGPLAITKVIICGNADEVSEV